MTLSSDIIRKLVIRNINSIYNDNEMMRYLVSITKARMTIAGQVNQSGSIHHEQYKAYLYVSKMIIKY